MQQPSGTFEFVKILNGELTSQPAIPHIIKRTENDSHKNVYTSS
jgi:hypothetical protein